MGGAAVLAPLGMLIALHLNIAPTLAIGALVAFAHLVFQVNMGALVVDLYPIRHVATVFGLIAAGSALGGFLSTHVVGQIASTGAYDRVFLLMGLLHPLAWLVAWASLRGKQ
jgi:ACS family hexuronate transporter-like MFS transporter